MGIICGLHRNGEGESRTECKKSLTFGASELTKAEAILRLKRWLVAGLDDADWPAATRQKHHVGLGGRQLGDYAGGFRGDLEHIAHGRSLLHSAR